MSLMQELKNARALTEREIDLRDYLLNRPEQVHSMSGRQLAQATFTSAATVTRFCKKFECDGWPDFKLRFVSELHAGHEQTEAVRLSERENMVTLLKKVSDSYTHALDATHNALSLSQLLRVQKLLLDNTYIDMYAYDSNIHLARYAASQLFHAGKIASAYSETDVQVLNALNVQKGHLAIIISHTGENPRLIALARVLRRGGTKTIGITIDKHATLAKIVDEFLYAYVPHLPSLGEMETDKLGIPAFFTATKYLLDLMFSIAFSGRYAENISLNRRYDTIGAASFWGWDDLK